MSGTAYLTYQLSRPGRVTYMMNYDQWRDLLRGEPLPAVVVDLEAFDRNVAKIARIVREAGHQQRLRVASKSVRVPELLRRVLRSGEPYRGLMCYAAAEAAFLASQGFDDLLVAYPTVQRSDLELLCDLHVGGKTVRLIVDSIEHLQAVSQCMERVRPAFPLVLDVDMSWRPAGMHLGVRRSPLRSVDNVLRLYEAAKHLPGIKIVGLMGYEAQVAGLADRNPFKKLLNPIAGMIRRRSVRHISQLRETLAQAIRERGYALELFNGGGTGSVNLAVDEPWLTELAAGSGFLCSHLFNYYSNVNFEPACFFVLQVVRSSDDGYATCLGGGYIASGEPGWDKVPVVHLPEGIKLVSTEGCGEVQTPLQLPEGVKLRPGDPVLMRHAKAGELAERFHEYLLVEQGRIVDRVPTYRGLGRSFI
ncbi:MAG: alanine racemase [Pirellulales bacterium]|nr:alanine racemase [Pirellulales bacterium]